MTGGSAREEAPPQPPPPRPTVSVSLPAWPFPTGRPAGRCPRQRGRPERPGLLQAVEGDWLTPPPGPAVGLTPDLSCPPWPPGLPPAVTHLTQTHAHRKEAWLTRAGGPGGAGRAGPLLPDSAREAREAPGAAEARGPRSALLSAGTRQRGVCVSLEWFLDLRGGGTAGPSFLTQHAEVGARRGRPPARGRVAAPGPGGFSADPAPQGHSPSHPWGLGSSGALETLKKRGPGLAALIAAWAGLAPTRHGAHARRPAPRAPRAVCTPRGVPGALQPRSSCARAPDCCAGTTGCQREGRRVQSTASILR